MMKSVVVVASGSQLDARPSVTFESSGSSEALSGSVPRLKDQETSIPRPGTCSPPEASTSGNNKSDVGSVVSKAKRAASSLWMLIHAQHCQMGGDRCPHQGCNEAKKVLLHLKTCPAQNGANCPILYHGCHQARKLLAHYRRCRELRAKQAGGRGSQQHVCLVCSLVARHARNLLEVGGSTSSSRRNPSGPRAMLSQPGPGATTVLIPDLGQSPTQEGMPPPPPRQPNSSAPIPISLGNKDVVTSPDNMCESPPTTNQLLQFSEVAAAAALPSPNEAAAADPALLGKSLDSTKSSFLTFAAGMLNQMKKAPSATSTPGRKSRAESFDAASASRSPSKEETKEHLDPTLEFELQKDNFDASVVDTGVKVRRTRSASLGVIVHTTSHHIAIDTIIEERPTSPPQCQADQPFLMEEEEQG